ncbi:putative HTH-type transcriptional regulator YbbH [Paenibacillus sp. CECT 9249]|uniref:MurR/RpiR family transcriptional regulator n=1 Tax=Paenibacillus sp. CECT 9249 TaxID=2845385 RepID=UPI001E583788|nr:MurR/RpiR family transcriptional regulator [Paenibacillus sp. CECT 9249]CAH0121191.1 putative HTH-type transcriptional regulator YbbH [Paenibacillus sp. CECT 9249]
MNGGLVRLREIIEDLTPSEKKVAQYILDYPEKMVGMSVAELARYSGGSQAAIIRLCKSMGLKGYKDLMLKVAGDLQGGEQVYSYQEIRPHDSMETIIQHVSNNNIQSIRDTVKILDAGMITKAVDAICAAERIYFYGLGASNLIAMDAQHKFMRINKTSLCFADPHLQLGSSVALTNKDVAVGISYSGETEHVIASLQNAKRAGAVTIGISKYGTTPLSTVADIPLYTSSTENEIRSGATSSRITQLNVVDILYLGVASRDYDHSVQYLEKSRSAINDLTGRSGK